VNGVVTDTCTAPQYCDGLLALYLFEEGQGTATVHDVSGYGAPLDLTIPNLEDVTWIPEGGLSVDESSLIASSGPATKISDAIRASNEFTLEWWGTPDNTIQNGPARIVTLSADSFQRNVSLAQGIFRGPSDLYNARVRSTDTSLNGIPSTTTDPGTLTTDLTHVVVTRDAAGVVRIYKNGGTPVVGSADGELTNWDSSFALALGREFDGTLQTWLGTYDQVAFYSRPFSAQEATQRYADGPMNTWSFSCGVDADCDDGAFCSGEETCDTGTGICSSGAPPCVGLVWASSAPEQRPATRARAYPGHLPSRTTPSGARMTAATRRRTRSTTFRMTLCATTVRSATVRRPAMPCSTARTGRRSRASTRPTATKVRTSVSNA
jgi:hypothetical protein